MKHWHHIVPKHAGGTKVELEHTKDKKVAREIAIDHIAEKPDYYKKLKKYVESIEMNEEKKTGLLKTLKRIVTRTDAGSRAHQELDKAHKVDPADSGKYIRRFKKFQAIRGVPVNEGSVQDTLHAQHQALRKKSGLPHPDYYKELGKSYDIEDHEERAKKQAEIRAKYGQQRESVEEIDEARFSGKKFSFNTRPTFKHNPDDEDVSKLNVEPKDPYHKAKMDRLRAGLADLKKTTFKHVKEDVEQLDEMPGANMDTRAVHQHLKKQGWKLTRSSGSHDVFTHDDAEHHIAVPRHRQLKAPLVKGILKQAKVNEETEVEKNSAAARTYKEKPEKQPMEKMKEAKEMKGDDPCWKGYEMVGQKMKCGKKVPNCVPVKEENSSLKAVAKNALQRQVNELKTFKESLQESRKAEIVKDIVKKKKESKASEDKFQPDPILTSQVVKEDK